MKQYNYKGRSPRRYDAFIDTGTGLGFDMAQIDVAPAKGLFGFLTYKKLPRLLYAGMTGFAPPLDVERWTLHRACLLYTSQVYARSPPLPSRSR